MTSDLGRIEIVELAGDCDATSVIGNTSAIIDKTRCSSPETQRSRALVNGEVAADGGSVNSVEGVLVVDDGSRDRLNVTDVLTDNETQEFNVHQPDVDVNYRTGNDLSQICITGNNVSTETVNQTSLRVAANGSETLPQRPMRWYVESPGFHRKLALPRDSVIMRNRRRQAESKRRRTVSATRLMTCDDESSDSDQELLRSKITVRRRPLTCRQLSVTSNDSKDSLSDGLTTSSSSSSDDEANQRLQTSLR
jgi:hypothetical protein